MADTPGQDWDSEDLRLAFLRWPEVAAACDAGYRTIILPCGAVEQHGPHLPLVVDTEHARVLGLLIAERLGRSLVAPTVAVGCSPHHMGFPGTLSLRPETLEAVLTDYAVSLSRHGFTSICCFSAHGGNFPVLRDAQPRIAAELDGSSDFIAFTDQDAFVDVWRTVVEERSGRGRQVGGHADIAESSIALALFEERVSMAAAQPGFTSELTSHLTEEVRRVGVHSLSENGVIGDPSGLNRDLGVACIAAMADMLAEFFQTGMRINR